jgi:hypothetical protein
LLCVVLAESRNQQMLMFDYTGITVRLKRSDSLLQPLQLVLQLKVCQLTSCMLYRSAECDEADHHLTTCTVQSGY